jgi:hypothetical protein
VVVVVEAADFDIPVVPASVVMAAVTHIDLVARDTMATTGTVMVVVTVDRRMDSAVHNPVD